MYYRKLPFFRNTHLDIWLLVGINFIAIVGLFILYSAKPDLTVIQRQILHLIMANIVMIGIAQISPRLLKSIAPWLYGIGLAFLISVLIMGQIGKGGQRWLDMWFVRFQPSELMKIAVPLMIAQYLDGHLIPPKASTIMIPLALTLIPAALIAKQPDLGTALLIFSSGAFVIFFSGIRWQLILYASAIISACLPIAWFFLYDYQRQRVLVFLDPEYDPLGKGYQIIQSKIAIGSGGLYGKGWLEGTQSRLEFLPERSTDFIFAVFSEEFGLVGCLILLTLYLCIIMRGLYISVQAQDTFSRLLSGSLIMTLFVYVFVNIGMVTGILPVVGVPLPLVSYGGTSLVTLMASFGILMSIHTRKTFLRK